jgi:undecaprenyl-diphosphatase
LLVTTVLLLVSDQARRRRDAAGSTRTKGSVAVPAAVPDPASPPREVGVLEALVIGCAQAVAICPGISRSGSTIAAGLLCGLEARDAARFSFLLSVPAIGGAALLQLRHLDTLQGGGVLPLAAAVGVAALVGFLALKLLLVGLARGAFRWFALYTAVVGVVLLVMLP